MITLTEPQVWSVIAVLIAAFFASLTLISTMFTRVVRAEINGVRSEIGTVRAEIGGVRSEIGSVRSEIDGVRVEVGSVRSEVASLRNEMITRFDAVNGRIDNLDRDVHFLMAREAER